MSRAHITDPMVQSFCDRYSDLSEAVHRHNSSDRQMIESKLQQMVLLGEVDYSVAKRVRSYIYQ